MSVVESCRKIEYDAFFMMIFIPVSNFGDQPLGQIFLCTKVYISFLFYFQVRLKVGKNSLDVFTEWKEKGREKPHSSTVIDG